jgi:ribosome biogenesis GTPase A
MWHLVRAVKYADFSLWNKRPHCVVKMRNVRRTTRVRPPLQNSAFFVFSSTSFGKGFLWTAVSRITLCASPTTLTTPFSNSDRRSYSSTSPLSQLQCPGCGSVLQCTDPTAVGYIPFSHFAALQRRIVSAVQFNQLDDVQNEIREHSSVLSPPLSIVCQRCHKLKHHNEAYPIPPPSDFSKVLAPLTCTPSGPLLVVLLVDLLDVEGSLLSGPILQHLLRPEGKRPPILLIGNKVDLLPSGVRLSRVRDWLTRRAKHYYHLQPLHTLVVSSRTGLNIAASKRPTQGVASTAPRLTESVQNTEAKSEDKEDTTHNGEDSDNDNDNDNAIAQILRLSYNRDVIVMGVQNVGKSTFINQLLAVARRTLQGQIMALSSTSPSAAEDTGNLTPLTTSHYPGTTVAPLAVPFAKIRRDSTTANTSQYGARYQHLYDTPGIPPPIPHFMTLLQRAEGSAEHEEMWELWQRVQMKKQLKPVVYGLHPGRTLFIGGLARLDYLSGPFAYFTVFTANNIYLHQTSTEHADDTWQKGVAEHKFLVPTLPPTLLMRWRGTKDTNLQAKTLKLSGKEGWKKAFVDIVFPGLGWVAVTGVGEFTVKAHFWDSSTILTREPIMPFESIRGLLPNPRANVKIDKT